MQSARETGAGDLVSAGVGGPTVTLPFQGVEHPLSQQMRKPDVRFRLPKFQNVKNAYTDPDLKIPEATVKARVQQLLERMAKDGRLKSVDPVPVIMGKIFPGPGLIDEAEFNNAIDVADRSKIYMDVADADTTVKTADKAKLQTAMADAIQLMKNAEGNAAGLKAVFGGQDATAKANYAKAQTALDTVSKDLDKHVTTDYNLDDPEVGLGGWARHSTQEMHLLIDVVKVTDANKAKTTLVHEASHLADSSVTDRGYYGSSGFEAMSETDKVTNAAHYEELPRRELTTSSFPGHTFTPGVMVGGAPPTREDNVRREVSEYLRKAWDASVDSHSLFRGLRRQYLAGNNAPFAANEVLIMEMSKLMDLTVHEQAAGKAIVTTLDVTLTESIAHAIVKIRALARAEPFPAPGVLTDLQLRDAMIASAVASYGNLLKDAVRDKALLDWMVAHYHSLPSV